MKTLKIEIPKGYQVDEEKSTFTNIVFKPIEKKWVDLGLPSGTLWCDINEEGYYSWDEMMNTFDEENLPKLTDFAELYDYCNWKWDDKKKGMWIIGPNTKSLFLPALGFHSHHNNNLCDVAHLGYYWSASSNGNIQYYFSFANEVIKLPCNDSRRYGHSVRCIKRIK